MFGHLRIKDCRLSEKDRSVYRSHFCSVCHNLHAFGGWDVSLLTNYDVTLWSLVASGVSAGDYVRPIEWRPCTALPMRKVEVQPLSAEMGASLAAITILLAWAKVEDHRQDGGRLLGWLGHRWLGKREARARDYLSARDYPLTALLQLPNRQAAAEKEPEPMLADLCQPTCDALADSFEWIGVLAERLDLSQHLRRLGQEIASFVYLWDAVQDLDKDRKSGAFNAVRAVWGQSFPVGSVRAELLGSLARMGDALAQLPLGNRRKLCTDLVESLAEKVRLHPALKQSAVPLPGPRRAIAQAGFLKTSDCDCGNSCCEAGCCDTGSGCGCCEVSCCDCHKGDACCELDCASCCGDGDCVICCCTDRGKGCSCCDCDCCGKGKKSSDRHGPSLTSDSKDTEDALICPGCRHDLQPRGAAQVCRSCTGVWVDGPGEPDLPSLRSGTQAPGIPRGSRTCPRCRSLLRSPFGGEGPESCDSCHGRFYST